MNFKMKYVICTKSAPRWRDAQIVKKDTQNSQSNQIRRPARRICDIFLEGNPISRKKNIFLAQFAAGVFFRKLKQIVEGVVVAGGLAPPSTQAVDFFDSLSAPR